MESRSLNPAQKQHLLSSCGYADKLLSDIESILNTAKSKSPFPKYQPDLVPAQIKVVEDYVARIRGHMVRVLKSQGIEPSKPQIGATHAIRVTLSFADIAFTECTPSRMRGYGDVPEEAVPELSGLVEEMNGLLAKLNAYLGQGMGQDLESRLGRLERAGAEIELVKPLERIIRERGLVQFRAALSAILDRLEQTSLEIAVFGRVSSGKSSLLNYIVESAVLPVGVTPVTAVPTRIRYGPAARGVVCLAGRKPEPFELSLLPEFVTEQGNPGNFKHVTRLMVELPSPRLQQGIILVDTPGLGSLATSGAAETLAYLPRCDLGIVLIDAGSTLAEDDIATLRVLYEAGIPALVLLSKADLHSADDLRRIAEYTASHIASELGIQLPVAPVSVQASHAYLLRQWIDEHITPLYERHQELAQQSLRRKIGALRESVEAGLTARLGAAKRLAQSSEEAAQFESIESELRKAAGKFADALASALRVTDSIRELGSVALTALARAIIERDSNQPFPDGFAASYLERVAIEQVHPMIAALRALAGESEQVLVKAGAALNLDHAARENEIGMALKEMPKLDLGDVDFRPDARSLIGKVIPGWARNRVESRLREQLGGQVENAFSSYGRILALWVRQVVSDMQNRFDSYADSYRAYLQTMTTGAKITSQEEQALLCDLEELRRSSAYAGQDVTVTHSSA